MAHGNATFIIMSDKELENLSLNHPKPWQKYPIAIIIIIDNTLWIEVQKILIKSPSHLHSLYYNFNSVIIKLFTIVK